MQYLINMKPTHYVYVKVALTTSSMSEAEKAGVIIANQVGGDFDKVEYIDELPF